MSAGTPIFPIEGIALDSTGELIANSLGDRVIGIQTIADALPAGADIALQANVVLIQAVTDALPAGADIALQATLEDVEDEVELVDQHTHNVERWWGALAGPTETNAIEANVTRPFAATSGNDTWGTAIPILGTGDNPVLAGMTTFDPHQILVVDLDDQTDPWRVRFIWGSGTSAAAIGAGQWSEIMVVAVVSPGNKAGGVPVEFRMPPIAVGSKMWAQSWNDSLNEVLDFFWGAHGYPYPPA